MMRNVFACLVHEAPDCVADLVANLRCLDPASLVLLYDGSQAGTLLEDYRPPDDNVLLHPRPRPQHWGALHGFAIDCMRMAVAELDADAITIVDSDQLLLRAGYSQALSTVLADYPEAGCLTSTSGPMPRATINGPARSAWAEADAWRPFLRRFAGGEAAFPHWTFWPSTVFTRTGAGGLLQIWEDRQLQELIAATRIMATEEVLLPTLAAVAGAAPVRSPFNFHCVQFRRRYTVPDLRAAMRRDNAFWAHPVPRQYADPLRCWLRDWNGSYRTPLAVADEPRGCTVQAAERAIELVSCIMLTRDRRAFVPLALDCFLRQDYPHRELVVVDDGDGDVADLVSGHPSVRYLRLGTRYSTGTRRNIGCAHARGGVIVHWDDDGWSAPWRLSHQVAALASAGRSSVCGQRAALYCDPLSGQAWRYEYPAHRRPWLREGTLCYRRQAWQAQPHHEDAPDGSAGFDLAGRAPESAVLADPFCHLAMLRPERAAITAGPWWHRLPGDEPARLLGADWPRYRQAAELSAERSGL
jgi:hypothetical protein